jgi:hypothetical protein
MNQARYGGALLLGVAAFLVCDFLRMPNWEQALVPLLVCIGSYWLASDKWVD